MFFHLTWKKKILLQKMVIGEEGEGAGAPHHQSPSPCPLSLQSY